MNDSTRPPACPGVLLVAPYSQGKARLPSTDNPIKLSSNESAFGPSPDAIAAYQSYADKLHRYSDGNQTELRTAIAEVHTLDVARIVCGNGSAELLTLLVRAYAGSGIELLLSDNHFEVCRIDGMAQGAEIVLAPEQGYSMDVDALLGALTPRTRMVMLANPNNPTGTYLSDAEVRRLHAGLAPDTLLVLDSAYGEYVTAADFEIGTAMVDEFENVVMTRTFSKMYGLAGVRIGWAYGPAHVVDVLQRIRVPFNTNAPALAAATAAVRDTAFIERVREHTARWQLHISDELAAMGLRVVPSVTNFFLIDFDSCTGKTAVDAAAKLEANGIIPRAVRAAGGHDNVLRITVGLDHENEAMLAALREYMIDE